MLAIVRNRSWYLASAIIACSLIMSMPQQAAATSKPAMRTVSVSATGQVHAAPDTAHLSTGVISEAANAKDALARNTAAMRKVVDGLKAAGIEAKDIQTTSFSVEPKHQQFKDGRPPVINGYQVQNQVRIVVRDLKRLGEALDQMVTLGANQVSGITFEVGGQEQLKDEARRTAMANALRRATLYAEAAGAKVGPVVSIEEEVRSAPMPRPMPYARTTMAASEAVPVEAGQQSLEVKVHVTWELQ